jgi:hypothetical protein
MNNVAIPSLTDLSLQIISKINKDISVFKTKAANTLFSSFERIDFNKFQYGQNYKLINSSIRNHIYSLHKIGRLYKFRINNRNISLYIIFPVYSLKKTKYTQNNRSIKNNKTSKNRISKDYQTILQNVYSILLIFIENQSNQPSINCSNNLTIYLYLTNLKKTLPKSTGENNIGETNVNTGFTFGCSFTNEIFIYRKEEWEKVFIHELIHAFGLDFASHPELNNMANSHMVSFFNMQSPENKKDLRLYEAYTETWATILNIIFQCVSLKNQNGYSMILNKINIQQLWSINQYIKIMDFYELHGSIFDNETQLILKEQVTLYSYYILKCRMLFYINDFFEFCVNKKGKYSETIDIIDFEKSKEMTKKYIQFIFNKVYCKTGKDLFETAILTFQEKRNMANFYYLPNNLVERKKKGFFLFSKERDKELIEDLKYSLKMTS